MLLWAVPGAGDSIALRCDPALFDHPVDHLPGMAQLEAFRQAATALAAGSDRPVAPLSRLEATFEHAVELDSALWCSATGSSAGEVHLRLHTGTPGSGRPYRRRCSPGEPARCAARRAHPRHRRDPDRQRLPAGGVLGSRRSPGQDRLSPDGESAT
ncbi:hypothetical protein GHK86_16855 [Acidimicrobiaceae bacterium USS-CC1]|uniref:A-factor biosynthesis hotdog domain-containing protein n=1 Tax=Acidiferrimicrobium australe TaxID=2664430 RepID=A0ABW9QXH3_9ACTN|nr:hypothetical protein [Acidiferrimicrobium australe]